MPKKKTSIHSSRKKHARNNQWIFVAIGVVLVVGFVVYSTHAQQGTKESPAPSGEQAQVPDFSTMGLAADLALQKGTIVSVGRGSMTIKTDTLTESTVFTNDIKVQKVVASGDSKSAKLTSASASSLAAGQEVFIVTNTKLQEVVSIFIIK